VVTVQGPALVRIRDEQGVRDLMVAEGAASRFSMPPGIAHAIQHLGTRATLLVVFRDRADEPTDPDVVREVLIEA
jgi:hypothetical protein